MADHGSMTHRYSNQCITWPSHPPHTAVASRRQGPGLRDRLAALTRLLFKAISMCSTIRSIHTSSNFIVSLCFFHDHISFIFHLSFILIKIKLNSLISHSHRVRYSFGNGWMEVSSHSQDMITITTTLLGGEVEVESGLESVQLEVTGGEESGGLRGLEEVLLDGSLSEGGGSGGGPGGGAEASLVSGEEAALVTGVEGVDEGVDSGAVSARGDAEVPHLGGGLLGGEVGAVSVEPEVAVGRVMGVDEGVEVGVHGLVSVVIVNGLGDGSGLDSGLDRGLDRSLLGNHLLGGEGGGVLAIGPGGDVGALDDPEAALAGGVPHGDGLAVLVDVAVLPDPLPVSRALLPEHGAVLLGEGGAVAAVTGVEPLLLQDLGVLGVNDTLAASGSNETSCGDKSEHDGESRRNFLSLLAWLK